MQLSMYYAAGSAAEESHRKNDLPIKNMDYPVIDIEGTGIRIRELIRESGHTVPEVSEYLGAST